MNGDLCLRNRQSTRNVDARLFRKAAKTLLRELLALEDFDLTIHLVESDVMATVNQTHLGHAGSTDVITLDYSADTASPHLTGEIYICIDQAVVQARRFRTTWQSEVARYLIHGALHLLGYDDLKPAARRRMKAEEERLLRDLNQRLHLSKLAGKSKVI